VIISGSCELAAILVFRQPAIVAARMQAHLLHLSSWRVPVPRRGDFGPDALVVPPGPAAAARSATLDLDQPGRRSRSDPGATPQAVPEGVPQTGFRKDGEELNYGAPGARNPVPATLPGPGP
jgi:hypothetical protein